MKLQRLTHPFVLPGIPPSLVSYKIQVGLSARIAPWNSKVAFIYLHSRKSHHSVSGRESRDPSSHWPWFLVRIQRRIWGFTCGKNKFIKERIGMSRMNRKNTSRERWVKPRQALALEDELRGFSRQGFYIFMHVVQHRLRVLIDSY